MMSTGDVKTENRELKALVFGYLTNEVIESHDPKSLEDLGTKLKAFGNIYNVSEIKNSLESYSIDLLRAEILKKINNLRIDMAEIYKQAGSDLRSCEEEYHSAQGIYGNSYLENKIKLQIQSLKESAPIVSVGEVIGTIANQIPEDYLRVLTLGYLVRAAKKAEEDEEMGMLNDIKLNISMIHKNSNGRLKKDKHNALSYLLLLIQAGKVNKMLKNKTGG